MAKNVIVSKDSTNYKKKYGKAYNKGKLVSFSKKEVDSIYKNGIKDAKYIINKNSKYELIGDRYYQRPSMKKGLLIGSAIAVVAAAGGATAGHFIMTNKDVGVPTITSTADGDLIISGGVAKKGSSYTATIQVPSEKQDSKELPYVIKEVKTGSKKLSLKEDVVTATNDGEEENYYSFTRQNGVRGEIYIHRVEGPVSVIVELNDKGTAARVSKVNLLAESNSVRLNGSIKLTASVYPSYATNATVSYKVLDKDGKTNSSLATVTGDGLLIAGDKFGTVKVVAVSNDNPNIMSDPVTINIGVVADSVGYSFSQIEGSLNAKLTRAYVPSETVNIPATVVDSTYGTKLNVTTLESYYSPYRKTLTGLFEEDDDIVTDKKHYLSQVTFDKNTQILEIPENCFKNCTKLTEIHIPSSVRKIGKGAFKNCTGLTKVIFDKDSELECFDEEAFAGCSSLQFIGFELNGENGETRYHLPTHLDSILKNAFQGCTTFTNREKVESDCPAFETIEIKEENCRFVIDKIENGSLVPFNYINPELVSTDNAAHSFVYENAPVTSNYMKFENLRLEENKGTSVLRAYEEAQGGEPYERVEIPSHRIAIYNDDEGGHPYVCKVVGIGGGYYNMNGQMGFSMAQKSGFQGNTTIKSVRIPYGVQSIYSNSFYGCQNLGSDEHNPIVLHGNIKYIGSWAFEDCRRMHYLELHEGIEEIDDGAFESVNSNSPSSIGLTIPSSVKYIGDCAFYDANINSLVFKDPTAQWFSTYDYDDNQNDLDRDIENNFKYQSFGTNSANNAKKLTDSSYRNYNFYKNYVQTLKYDDWDEDYSFNGYQPLKQGVEYCYGLDFTDDETGHFNGLSLYYQFGRETLSDKVQKVAEGQSAYVVVNNSDLMSEAQVTGVQIYAGDADVTSEAYDGTYKEYINYINSNHFVDLSKIKEKYKSKVYVYLTFNVSYFNYKHAAPSAPDTREGQATLSGNTNIDITITEDMARDLIAYDDSDKEIAIKWKEWQEKELMSSTTSYNFTPSGGLLVKPEYINTEEGTIKSNDDYTLNSDRVEITEENQKVEFTLDCSEFNRFLTEDITDPTEIPTRFSSYYFLWEYGSYSRYHAEASTKLSVKYYDGSGNEIDLLGEDNTYDWKDGRPLELDKGGLAQIQYNEVTRSFKGYIKFEIIFPRLTSGTTSGKAWTSKVYLKSYISTVAPEPEPLKEEDKVYLADVVADEADLDEDENTRRMNAK